MDKFNSRKLKANKPSLRSKETRAAKSQPSNYRGGRGCDSPRTSVRPAVNTVRPTLPVVFLAPSFHVSGVITVPSFLSPAERIATIRTALPAALSPRPTPGTPPSPPHSHFSHTMAAQHNNRLFRARPGADAIPLPGGRRPV